MKKKLLFAGDSITDAGRLWGTDALGCGYVRKIWEALGEPEDLLLVNKGFSGWTASQLRERWQEICIDQAPDCLTILVGINDIACCMDQRTTLEALGFREDYEYLVSRVRQETEAAVMVMTPFLFSEQGEYGAWRPCLEETAAIIMEIAQKYHLEYLPLHEIFLELCRKEPMGGYTEDGIHPTAKGHTVIAAHWLGTARRMGVVNL